ncbi:MATE family efflux transporter, partial [Parabacteroides sp.]
WSIIGKLGFAIKDQGSNIVLNLFYGVSLNAARGIALQVNGVVSNFYQSFIMAINPQITKQYAAGDVKASVNLVYAGCRFSFFLISLISIPIMINMDYLLSLWLGKVPDYTSRFLFYALWAAVINSMAGPLVTAMQATGRIMLFQIVICLVMMCEMPLSYLVLRLGYEPYYIMFASILVVFVGLFARILLLKRLVPDYSLGYFTLNIIAKNLLVILVCYALSAFVKGYFDDNFMNLVLTSFVSFVMTLLIIYGLGIGKQERAFINAKILALYHRFLFVNKKM